VAHQNVVAFDVAVDGVCGMGGGQGPGQLGEEQEHLLGAGGVLIGPDIEGRAFYPLHDEEGLLGSGGVAQHSLVQQAGDAGVAEAGEQLRLASEARIPRVDGELESGGPFLLLADAEGTVDGAGSALVLPSHHAPLSHQGA
jgi:hypothetical protein